MNKCIKVFVVLIFLLLFFILSIIRYNNFMSNRIKRINKLSSNMKLTNASNYMDKKYVVISEIDSEKYDKSILLLNEYVKENNIDLFYLEFSNLNNSEREDLYSKNKFFENGIVLPVLIKFENKKIVNVINIEESKKELDKFFMR